MEISAVNGRRLGLFGAIFLFALSTSSIAQITTAQVDDARTGAYLKEGTLTPRNVNPHQFGKLFFDSKWMGTSTRNRCFLPGCGNSQQRETRCSLCRHRT